MGILLAIRHLETQDNREQRFSSGDRDVSILPGQHFAGNMMATLGKFRKEELIIVHTGLRRSIETTVLLMRLLGYLRNPLVVSQFRERFGGELAGLRFSELQQLFPELRSPNQLWGIEAPEMGLESVATFLARIEEGITQVARLVPVSCVAIAVAHAGSIKGIRAVLTEKEVDTRKQILCESTPQNQEVVQFQYGRR